MHDQAMVVKAGETKNHRAELPPLVVFDHGNGSEAARKLLKGSKYIVGVDASQQRLAPFDADKLAPDAMLAHSDQSFRATKHPDTPEPIRSTAVQSSSRAHRVQRALRNQDRDPEIDRFLQQLKAGNRAVR